MQKQTTYKPHPKFVEYILIISFLILPINAFLRISIMLLHKLSKRSENMNENSNTINGNELVKNTLDQIPQTKSDAKRITGLVKENGRVTGYQLSDNSIVEKPQAVQMAKQGEIMGVGIAHRGDNEYLKSIPNDKENDNLSNLPAVVVE